MDFPATQRVAVGDRLVRRKTCERSALRIALITGITDQTGALLAELLLTKGYDVHGVNWRFLSFSPARVDRL